MKSKVKQHPIYSLQIGGEITMIFNVYLGCDTVHTFTLINRDSYIILLKCGDVIYRAVVNNDREIILTHALNTQVWKDVVLPTEMSLRTGEFISINDRDWTYEYSTEDEIISGPLSA